MVKRQLKTAQTFLYYMAQQELSSEIPQVNHSLLTLLKRKEKWDSIDIKKHALFPLHHCLQILGGTEKHHQCHPIAIARWFGECRRTISWICG